jgi:hypothetical protein
VHLYVVVDLLEQAGEQEQAKDPVLEKVAKVVEHHNPEQGFEEGVGIELELQVANFEGHQPGVEANSDIDVHWNEQVHDLDLLVEEEEDVQKPEPEHELDLQQEGEVANFEEHQPSVEADADIDVH